MRVFLQQLKLSVRCEKPLRSGANSQFQAREFCTPYFTGTLLAMELPCETRLKKRCLANHLST